MWHVFSEWRGCPCPCNIKHLPGEGQICVASLILPAVKHHYSGFHLILCLPCFSGHRVLCFKPVPASSLCHSRSCLLASRELKPPCPRLLQESSPAGWRLQLFVHAVSGFCHISCLQRWCSFLSPASRSCFHTSCLTALRLELWGLLKWDSESSAQEAHLPAQSHVPPLESHLPSSAHSLAVPSSLPQELAQALFSIKNALTHLTPNSSPYPVDSYHLQMPVSVTHSWGGPSGCSDQLTSNPSMASVCFLPAGCAPPPTAHACDSYSGTAGRLLQPESQRAWEFTAPGIAPRQWPTDVPEIPAPLLRQHKLSATPYNLESPAEQAETPSCDTFWDGRLCRSPCSSVLCPHALLTSRIASIISHTLHYQYLDIHVCLLVYFHLCFQIISPRTRISIWATMSVGPGIQLIHIQ